MQNHLNPQRTEVNPNAQNDLPRNRLCPLVVDPRPGRADPRFQVDVWQGVKTGRFPAPQKLGPRTTVWLATDIRALFEASTQDPKGR